MDIINLKEEPNLIPTLAKWHHNEWSYLNSSLTLNERIYKMEAYLSNEIIPSKSKSSYSTESSIPFESR